MCFEKFYRNLEFPENIPKYTFYCLEKCPKTTKIEVLDMPDLQSAQNDSKNDKNANFIIFPANSNLDLHFDIGFDGIRELEQFLCNFEICS